MNKKIFFVHADSERIIRHVHIIAKSGIYLHVRPSVAHVSARVPLDGFPWNLILGNVYENLLLYMKIYVRFIVAGVIKLPYKRNVKWYRAISVAEEV